MMVWGWLLFAWAQGAGTSPCDGRNGELVVEGSTSVLGKFICYDIYMLEIFLNYSHSSTGAHNPIENVRRLCSILYCTIFYIGNENRNILPRFSMVERY